MKEWQYKDEETVLKVFEWCKETVQDYYLSTSFDKWWTRYENRLAAYHCRASSSDPQWRSKLYMPTYFLGVKALEAQFKAAHKTDPFLWVKPADNSRIDAEAKEKAALAHADLNYDLRVSNFREKKNSVDWYTILSGVGVGREFARVYNRQRRRAQPGRDVYGFSTGGVQEQMTQEMVEKTCTDVIHPLNFAHDIHRQNFLGSSWGSVRFLMHIQQVYAMLGNDRYYQPGVKKIIQVYEDGKGGLGQITTGKDQFYSENIDEVDNGQWLVVDEFQGPMVAEGYYGNFTKNIMLYSKTHDAVLLFEKLPFRRIGYWKQQCYPSPNNPFGIDPCAMLLPLNRWENSTINQYVDYMNSALKFMYKVWPDVISGGPNALINGLPFGMVFYDGDNAADMGRMIEGINHGSMPPVADVMGLVQRYRQEIGPSSNLRGKSTDQLQDTATGISLMAQREDTVTAALQDGVDMGLQDCALMKIHNMIDFHNGERAASIGDKQADVVLHYPFELDGLDYAVTVERRLADVEAGKAISYLRMIQGLDKYMMMRKQPLPTEFLLDSYEDVAKALGQRDVDEKWRELRAKLTEIPAEIGGGGAPGAIGALGMTEGEAGAAMAGAMAGGGGGAGGGGANVELG